MSAAGTAPTIRRRQRGIAHGFHHRGRGRQEFIRRNRGRFGRRGWPDGIHAHHGRRPRPHARGRAELRPRDRDADDADRVGRTPARCGNAGEAFRFLGRDDRRRLAGTRRAVHDGLRRSRAPVRLVASAHARRSDQSLGPHLIAQRHLRLQAAHSRRSRARLAHGIRGSRALLRQGRDADRRVWRRRRHGEHTAFLEGRAPAAAEAARVGPAREAARREGRRPGDPDAPRRADEAARSRAPSQTTASREQEGPVDHRRGHAEARRVFLGDSLRPRLLDSR